MSNTPDIGICSLIGGISVSCTQGLGACILTSIRGSDQVSKINMTHDCMAHNLTMVFTVQELVYLLPYSSGNHHTTYVFTSREFSSDELIDYIVTEIYYLNVALALFNTGKKSHS